MYTCKASPLNKLLHKVAQLNRIARTCDALTAAAAVAAETICGGIMECAAAAAVIAGAAIPVSVISANNCSMIADVR